ncbi:MAG: SDR family oxidoreductase [Chloroflexi bacterium]|nr:SDR family oxidoreductase [Chloroflexota bacterium]
MDLGLGGKAAVITGGSQGIGYAAARVLAREGARVLIAARQAERLERAAMDLAEETGGQVVAFRADVTHPEDVADMIQAAIERFGKLDAFVSNAGASLARPFTEVTDEQWQSDLELKLLANIRGARLAIPHLKAAGGGSIVSVLSVMGKTPAAGSTPTSVSRAAGIALMKVLSKELAPDNIRVNSVNIGLIKSGQHERRWIAAGRSQSIDDYYAQMAEHRSVPLKRIGEAEEAADLIAFLCSERAKYITGAAINMDGGLSPAV